MPRLSQTHLSVALSLAALGSLIAGRYAALDTQTQQASGSPLLAVPTPADEPAAALDGQPPTVVAELTEEAPTAAPAVMRRPDAIADLVLLISVDGLRHDAVYPHSPTVHRLALEGATAVNARTISKSSTLPSHASMVSGVDVDQHGLGFNSFRPERGHIQYPTIFSAAHKAGLPTGVFVGKRKLQHLLQPDKVDHFEVGGVFCSRVTRLAVPYLGQARSGIVFAHFSDPDSAGHRYGWMSDAYTEAVRRADRCVRELIDTVRGHDIRDRIMVVVTSDHGGHDHNHGSRRKLDRQIPLVMWGTRIKPGTRVHRRVFNTDTAATILHGLGLEPPEGILGRPVTEAILASD